MATNVPGFPNSFQSEYARIPKAPLPGDLWEGELFQERPIPGLIPVKTEVAYGATVTIAAFNSGDEVGVVINGVTIPVTAVTDADATAALLNAAINSATLLSGVISSTVAGAVLTLVGALGQEITVTEYSPDATTAAVTGVTASVVQSQLDYGYGVVRDIPSLGTTYTRIKKPSASTDKFVGVIVRTIGTDLPAAQILATDALYNANYLMPGQVYTVMRENAGVVVEYVSASAPLESDPVYLVYSGANAGKWSTSDGGVSQVTSGTLTFNGTDAVGLIVDSLPTLSVASNTSSNQTATDLRTAWNASAQHYTIAVMSGSTNTITLTFVDDAAHTVTAYSPATADITGIANSATAVTPTAMLIPGYSWGRPSIPAASDLPARAFLRLSNP